VSARDRIILTVVVCVAAVAASWMFVIQPKRKDAATLSSQVTSLQSQLSTARDTVGKGLAARSQFATDYTELAELGEALPQDDNVPSLVYELQSAASAAKVNFNGLQLVPGGAASTTPSSSSSASSSSSSSSASSAGPLPPGASLGPAGFPTEQFTFTFAGSFFHLSSFFHRLAQFVVAGQNTITVRGRLMTVNAISFQAGPAGFPQIQATVSATTYMAPASTGLTAGATAAGPAGTTSTTPSSSGSATPAAATITSPR
jgi:hypothetical protein